MEGGAKIPSFWLPHNGRVTPVSLNDNPGGRAAPGICILTRIQGKSDTLSETLNYNLQLRG